MTEQIEARPLQGWASKETRRVAGKLRYETRQQEALRGQRCLSW